MAGQKNLTTLQLIDADYAFKKPFTAENVPFKLKKLSLSSFDSGRDNILAFMKLHGDFLETLELGLLELGAPIYEFIFAKLKKLKKLSLIVDTIDDSFKCCEINPSVKTLKLFEQRRSCPVSKAVEIIRCVPNIENLVMPFDEPYEKLSAAMDHLKQLKHLTVETFSTEFWENATFPKLESLKFINAELDQGSDIALVTTNMNLKSLSFDGKVDNDFLNAIAGNFPKLVSLNLRKSKVNVEVTSHIRGLRLRENDFYDLRSIYGDFFCQKDIPYRDPDFDNPISDFDDDEEMFDFDEHDFEAADEEASGDGSEVANEAEMPADDEQISSP